MLNQSSFTAPRRSERVLLKIPIRVEGRDDLGQTFVETTHTLVVNRSGGLIALSHRLQQGDVIRITNLNNHASGSFEVVMRASVSLSGKPEWGVKCLEPEVQMWGVYFPDRTEETSRPSLTHVLLACRECSSREMAVLTAEQYQRLMAESRLSRPCPKCGVVRDWEFAEMSTELGGVAPRLSDASSSGSMGEDEIKRRRERCLVTKLPLEVKLPDGSQEVSRTENLTESSLCFASNFEMHIGDRVSLTVGVDATEDQRDIPACILWRHPASGKGRTFYGARLENGNSARATCGLPAFRSRSDAPAEHLSHEF